MARIQRAAARKMPRVCNDPIQMPEKPGPDTPLQAQPYAPLRPTWRSLRDRITGANLEVLPSYVQRSLELQRQRNEILAGWVQAAMVLIFALFYGLSRKTFSADMMFHPVPWALGVYGGFTALRLLLAYRNRLGHGMLMLSVVVDITVLMVTIWSFHIQYEQVPAFYLKAPTLLYVFIFIALRSLSLSPVYVLFAGGCAALGWLVLVDLAIYAPGGRDLITRDYVAYMSSLQILIGAELDKIISIVMVTMVLAIAASRARSLLHRSVAGQAAASQLARFFAPEIAATIVSADEILQPGQGRQVEAAAMFVDMRGFTQLASTLDPQTLIALLGEYQRLVVPIIRRNGGSIITFLGDGIMVTFGATQPSASYAADALRTSEQVLDAMGVWKAIRAAQNLAAPDVGIGVATGTVTCGTIGDEGRLEYAVIGEPVNCAAKLQNHTKVEQVRALATAEALQRAIGQGYNAARATETRLARQCAGIAEPMDLVVIA